MRKTLHGRFRTYFMSYDNSYLVMSKSNSNIMHIYNHHKIYYKRTYLTFGDFYGIFYLSF